MIVGKDFSSFTFCGNMQTLLPLAVRVKGTLLSAGKVGKKRKAILRYTEKCHDVCVSMFSLWF